MNWTFESCRDYSRTHNLQSTYPIPPRLWIGPLSLVITRDTHNLQSTYPISLRLSTRPLSLVVITQLTQLYRWVTKFNSNICTNVKYTKLDDQEALPCLPPTACTMRARVHDRANSTYTEHCEILKDLLSPSIVQGPSCHICVHLPVYTRENNTCVHLPVYTRENNTYCLSPSMLKAYMYIIYYYYYYYYYYYHSEHTNKRCRGEGGHSKLQQNQISELAFCMQTITRQTNINFGCSIKVPTIKWQLRYEV